VSNAARTPARRRRHPLATFVVLLVALVGVGTAYAALSGLASGTAQAAGSIATPQQIEQGKQLFLEGCSSCHGLAAQGTSNGPTLIGVGAAAVDFQVGTGRMPAAQFGPQIQATKVSYTQEQIDALAAYVASLAPGPAIPTADQLNYQDANLQEGGALFRTNCAQCHNFAGKGGALTEGKFAPPLTGASAKYIYEAMLTGPQSMPVFADTTLPQAQKQAIIKYIKAVQAEPNPGGLSLGRIGPVSEGLLLWVLGLGLVTAVAVWIGAKVS
jgi:ubiquinol-cytochrome c reductase cytochrome c subunit